LGKIQKIAVFTSIRSEYGVMIPLLKLLNQNFNLDLLVGGAHLLEEHGNTLTEIENDGFTIKAKFPFLHPESEPSFLTRSMGTLLTQMGDYFHANRPDILIVVGDRFELLPVVNAALVLNIPIAHISGGDVTEGAIDNQVRHAISKMAHIHFPGTEVSRNNLLKMGEEDWRIYNTGEPGIDCILSINPIGKDELYKDLELDVKQELVIATFHPETITNEINTPFLNKLFDQLLLELPTHQFLVTASNFDLGGEEINQAMITISQQHKNVNFVKSLGQKRYYSVLKYADFMLGNSSSGIIEAQSFMLPVINMGDRQKGRERNVNTLDVENDISKIIRAIHSIKDENFKEKIKKSSNLYGEGKCSEKIVEVLLKIDTSKLLSKKSTF